MGARDDTTLGGAGRRFPATEWTKLLAAPQSEAVLAELYTKYRGPLYTYLCYRGLSSEEAGDLVQGFFTDKVLGMELLGKADRSRGKLRTFLLTALRNYAVNVHKARAQGSRRFEMPYEPCGKSPEDQFNRAWADRVLQEALQELEAECRATDKAIHWEVFRTWLLGDDPGGGPSKLADLCAEYGIDRPERAHNMLTTVKRRFRAILRERVGTEVGSKADIDSEIADFIAVFTT